MTLLATTFNIGGERNGRVVSNIIKYSRSVNQVVKAANATDDVVNAVDDVARVISKGDYLRIKNAANRINKPISVVGSRASGKAGAYSDWDYVIHGGLKNSREWSKIKNSLPGARSIPDNTPRNIDILPGPVRKGTPHITIYPN